VPPPGEAQNVRVDADKVYTWDATAGATFYGVVRGLIGALPAVGTGRQGPRHGMSYLPAADVHDPDVDCSRARQREGDLERA
jgi:hypothetical protein